VLKYGPGTINPGSDLSRPYLELPLSQGLYMALHVHITYGTAAQIKQATGITFRNLAGILTGATFDVPRNFRNSLSTFDFPKDEPNGGIKAEGLKWTTWTSDTDGVIVGIGGHLHMGGLYDQIENLGGNPALGLTPCVGDSIDGGTILVKSESIMRD